MVTFPAGRFWSFCFWAAVLGVMTLNPEATSMFSLFCVVVCVLAQLINSAAHPAAILLRKRRVVGFIDGVLPLVQNPSDVCNAYAYENSELFAACYLGFRYFICLVPASRLSSGRSSINSSAGTGSNEITSQSALTSITRPF